jgi:hypothetical protein
MNSDDLYGLMKSGATVKLYIRTNKPLKRRQKYVLSLPDGTTKTIQGSLLAPLLDKKQIRGMKLFGGSYGDYKYEVINDDSSQPD